MIENDELQARLKRVEEQLMYYEHLNEELNVQVCALNRRQEIQDRQIKVMIQALERFRSSIQEPRTLADDKPPHY